MDMKITKMIEMCEEAQASNEKVVASSATSVNNVPACESVVDDQPSVGGSHADVVQDLGSNHVDQVQQPLMKERVVYTLDNDTLQNLFVIKSNRREEKQIKAKQKSCREYGMIIPGQFTDATVAFDAGYELINPLTGETVKRREETYGKLVVMEGTTRLWALLAEMERIEDLKRKRKDGDEKPFEYTLTYRHITDPKVFKNLYRHINIDNVPTRTKDFARDFLATERENKFVTSYANKIDRGLSPKGAGFATSFKDVKKADIETLLAGKDPAVFNSSNKNDLEISDMIYNGVLEGFAIEKGAPVKNKVLKGSFIWRWIANKMNEADEGDRLDLAVKVISIFTSMSAQDSERINNAEKTETQTREQVIHAILDGMYNKNN